MAHANEGYKPHGSTKSYVIGYLLSIVLTILPLWFVLYHLMNRTTLLVTIIIMAALQFFIQLFFFMHIRDSEKPRWNALAVIFGVIFVFTIVAGSIWIMTFNSQVQ